MEQLVAEKKAAVVTANTRVAQLESELEIKRGEVQARITCEEILASEPDLLEMDRLSSTLDERENIYKNLLMQREEHQKSLLAEAKASHPFLYPGLAQGSAYYNWLIDYLQHGFKCLRYLLTESRLWPDHKKDIQRVLGAPYSRQKLFDDLQQDLWLKRARIEQLYDQRRSEYVKELERDIMPHLDRWPEEIQKAKAELEQAQGARNALRCAEKRIAHLRNTLVEMRTAREQTRLQEATQDLQAAIVAESEESTRLVEAKLADLPALSISKVLSLLPDLPKRCADSMLDRLLAMEVDDPHLHDLKVQDFLKKECHRRGGTASLLRPAFIAMLSRLAMRKDRKDADSYMRMLPNTADSPLAPVIEYLKFVLDDGPVFSRVTKFQDLKEQDVYLGAAYYGDDSERTPRLTQEVRATLSGLERWDYQSLQSAFIDRGCWKAFDNFKVRGLQPRIAERAFGGIYRVLHAGEPEPRLEDKNANVVLKLTRPWRLDTKSLKSLKSLLLGADWRDSDRGTEHDVKSNLFFPGSWNNEGLRGFFIRPRKRLDDRHSYPGFVFTDSKEEECTWCYVGTYTPKESCTPPVRETRDGLVPRICPFLFRLPDRSRFDLAATFVPRATLVDGAWILRDFRLFLGWQLATRSCLDQSQTDDPAELMAHELVARCAKHYKDTILEEALWRAMTDITFEGCSEHGLGPVNKFLDIVYRLISSPALPLRLPRIGKEPILGRWVNDVLRRVAEVWDRISCPNCKQDGSVPGVLLLSNILPTAEGSIDGYLSCRGCRSPAKRVRILTHCHGCGKYPLILGENKSCSKCFGLVCNGEKVGGVPCRCCKGDGCEGFKSRQRQEELAVSDPPNGS